MIGNKFCPSIYFIPYNKMLCWNDTILCSFILCPYLISRQGTCRVLVSKCLHLPRASIYYPQKLFFLSAPNKQFYHVGLSGAITHVSQQRRKNWMRFHNLRFQLHFPSRNCFKFGTKATHTPLRVTLLRVCVFCCVMCYIFFRVLTSKRLPK